MQTSQFYCRCRIFSYRKCSRDCHDGAPNGWMHPTSKQDLSSKRFGSSKSALVGSQVWMLWAHRGAASPATQSTEAPNKLESSVRESTGDDRCTVPSKRSKRCCRFDHLVRHSCQHTGCKEYQVNVIVRCVTMIGSPRFDEKRYSLEVAEEGLARQNLFVIPAVLSF